MDLARNLIQRINVGDTLTRSAAARADHPAVVDGERRWTYAEFNGPKGVVASHVAVYLESTGSALDSQWNHTDRFAAMMPMFHTAQLNAFCTPAMLVGATIYVLRGFDPAALLNLIETERISQVFGLPMMYRALLDHPSFPDRELTACAAG